MSTLIALIVIGLAIVGAFTVWGAWNRYWDWLSGPTRTLLIGLVLTPLGALLGVFLGGLAVLVGDGLLDATTSWQGLSDGALNIWLLAVALVGVIYLLFLAISDFAEARKEEARQADAVVDALQEEIQATLTEEEQSKLWTNSNTISAFPGLSDVDTAQLAYGGMREALAPYPELSQRFFDRFDPVYEARMSAVLYGVPRGWRKRRFQRRLLSIRGLFKSRVDQQVLVREEQANDLTELEYIELFKERFEAKGDD